MKVCINNYEQRVCVTIFQEYDYYDQIVEFYEKTLCNPTITRRDIDIWESRLIINLMQEMKNDQLVSTDIDMDIVKKIILMILMLFKENKNGCEELKELPATKKSKIIEDMSYFL